MIERNIIFPTINASLNALSFVFLLLGWRAIKQKNKVLHKKFMLAALTTSSIFLISYVTYHAMIHGVTRYQGAGLSRAIYFLILGTHTPLAAAIVPFCIAAVYFALKSRFDKHVRITRYLLPVWLYVSLTGVIIYLMLYIF